MTLAQEILGDFLRLIGKLKEIEGDGPVFLFPKHVLISLDINNYLGEKYKPKPWYFLHHSSVRGQNVAGYYFLPRRLGKTAGRRVLS